MRRRGLPQSRAIRRTADNDRLQQGDAGGASGRVERQDVRQPVIAAGVGEYVAGGTSVAE
jgi:hypothetical protein